MSAYSVDQRWYIGESYHSSKEKMMWRYMREVQSCVFDLRARGGLWRIRCTVDSIDRCGNVEKTSGSRWRDVLCLVSLHRDIRKPGSARVNTQMKLAHNDIVLLVYRAFRQLLMASRGVLGGEKMDLFRCINVCFEPSVGGEKKSKLEFSSGTGYLWLKKNATFF
jgi:hypothetical protein